MDKSTNIKIGVRYGLITGILYCVLIFLKLHNSENRLLFSLFSGGGYILILGILVLEAFNRKKKALGIIGLKPLFQTLFLSVIIFELMYTLYTFIHIKYIEPSLLMSVQNQKDASNIKFSDLPKIFLMSLSVSGFFAFLISLLLRTQNPNSIEKK